MTKCIISTTGLTLIAWVLSACIGIYTPEVQQGNVVTQEMIDKLKLGMTRRQVRFILGTPLIEDPFHQDRWDYYYFRKRGNETGVRRKLSIIFKDNILVEIRGNVQVKLKDAPGDGSNEQETLLTHQQSPPTRH